MRHTSIMHSTSREGIRLGLIIGVATWLWLAGYDFVTGDPFHTFHFFGGFMGFTVVHFTLCLAYGWAIIGAVHGSVKEPTVIFALIFCTILFQAAFAGLAAILDNVGMGQVAWGKFFLGNVMAAGLTYVLIAHDHPMRELFHAAEARQKD